MAQYRTYKNGITGHRYNGYYIIKGEEKGKFSVWNADKSVFMDNIYDYDECEWIIDKEIANQSTETMMRMLYDKEIYELSDLLLELMQKKQRNGKLDSKSKELYDLVVKIRKRKAEDRPF